jgi:GntR family transcriptional regulator
MTEPLSAGVETLAPLYKEVKRSLTSSLMGGEWQPGEALPSETRLAQRFHVSIGTLRKAVDELVAERVLVRQQGRGTFVATHGAKRFLFHFFHIVPHEGEKALPALETLAFGRDSATPAEARRLALPSGARVIRIRNLLRLAGEPIIVDDLVLPREMFSDLTEKKFRERDGTIYSLYQTRYGINVVRAVERLRAAVADRTVARLLRVAPGAPLLEINRTALTYRDQPVELRRSLVNTARHEYLSDLGKGGED